LDFDRPVTASISADGKHVLVGRSFISSGVEYFSAVLYGADGKQVWTKTYREDRYRTIQVSSPGAGGHFGVALFTYNNPGIAYLYNAQGQRLWSRSVTSSATLVLDPGTLALYGIDHGKRELFSASVSTGQSRNLGTISERSSLELGGGSLLVTDMSTAMLLGTDGSLVLRQPVPADFTGLSLAPDGSAVYAATRGADSSVLRLNERGGVSWSTRIPAAGSNSIIVSPTGRYVLVFNITLDSGFVVLDAADGSILCRNTFAPVEDTASQFIRWARFLPEDDAVLIDYAVSRSRPSGHVEEHSLLLFSMAGELRARFNAGANVDLLVSDDGRACVTVSTVAYDWSGPTPNRVRFYDLTPTFGLRRP
jgi:DNA-binding beta-propeller fold protein YncE